MPEPDSTSFSRRAWLERISTPALVASVGAGFVLAARAADAPGAATAPSVATGTRVYNVRDHGAKGDGVALDTAAVQAALDACAADRGGIVLVPAGDFVIGTIELKSSDGDSWYRAMILEMRQRLAGLTIQSSYTFSRSEDTTQASTFFSDATNGTTSAMPEFIPDYNKGPSDFDATHNWVMNFTWQVPFARGLSGAAGRVLDGWRVSGIVNVRSGSPLTVFVQSNRSRSQWAPSLGPGLGPDRPSWAPGRDADNAIVGTPDRWIDPAAFVLQPAGTFGNTGRGELRGPNLRSVDVSLSKIIPWAQFGSGSSVEARLEAFNVLNRANFGMPALLAFAGAADNEQPFSTFGRITNTVTSSRQIQLGVRVAF